MGEQIDNLDNGNSMRTHVREHMRLDLKERDTEGAALVGGEARTLATAFHFFIHSSSVNEVLPPCSLASNASNSVECMYP